MRLIACPFSVLIFSLLICNIARCFFGEFNFDDIFGNAHQQQPISTDESYYTLFGMTRATFDENALKKSYRSLVKKYHPDHNSEPDASERFREITNAYEVLSDPEQKQIYDTRGKEGIKMGGANGNGNHPHSHPGGFPFDMFFNADSSSRPASQRASPKSPTAVVEINVSLEEIFSGTEKILQFTRHSFCKKCKGTGSNSHSDIIQCPSCQGSGIKVVTQVIGPFVQRMQTQCQECKGTGKKITKPCPQCNGSKVFIDNSPVRIQIPPGIKNDEIIVLEEVGDAGADGRFTPGDIHCKIKEIPHPIFRRGKKDPSILSMDLSISLRDSLLGWSTTITGVSGNPLSIARENTITPPGFVLEIPNGGLPKNSGIVSKRGLLFVSISVVYPKHLSATEISWVKEKNMFQQTSKPEYIPTNSRSMYPIHDDL